LDPTVDPTIDECNTRESMPNVEAAPRTNSTTKKGPAPCRFSRYEEEPVTVRRLHEVGIGIPIKTDPMKSDKERHTTRRRRSDSTNWIAVYETDEEDRDSNEDCTEKTTKTLKPSSLEEEMIEQRKHRQHAEGLKNQSACRLRRHR